MLKITIDWGYCYPVTLKIASC